MWFCDQQNLSQIRLLAQSMRSVAAKVIQGKAQAKEAAQQKTLEGSRLSATAE